MQHFSFVLVYAAQAEAEIDAPSSMKLKGRIYSPSRVIGYRKCPFLMECCWPTRSQRRQSVRLSGGFVGITVCHRRKGRHSAAREEKNETPLGIWGDLAQFEPIHQALKFCNKALSPDLALCYRLRKYLSGVRNLATHHLSSIL